MPNDLGYHDGNCGQILHHAFCLIIRPGHAHSTQSSDDCGYSAAYNAQKYAVEQRFLNISVMPECFIPFQGKSCKAGCELGLIKGKYHHHHNGEIHDEQQDGQINA